MQRALISDVFFTHPYIMEPILSFLILERTLASFNSTPVTFYERLFFDILYFDSSVLCFDKVVIENASWFNDYVFFTQEPFCFDIVFLCILAGLAEVALVPETRQNCCQVVTKSYKLTLCSFCLGNEQFHLETSVVTECYSVTEKSAKHSN